MLSALLQDIRYGVRMLVKNPGVAIVAILTLSVSVRTPRFSALCGAFCCRARFMRADPAIALRYE